MLIAALRTRTVRAPEAGESGPALAIGAHLLVWAVKRNEFRAPEEAAGSRQRCSSGWRLGCLCVSVPSPDAALGDGDVAGATVPTGRQGARAPWYFRLSN